MFNKYLYKSVIYCMQIHMKQWIFCIVTYSDAEIPLGMGSHALLHLWTWTLIAVVTEKKKNRPFNNITNDNAAVVSEKQKHLFSHKQTYLLQSREEPTNCSITKFHIRESLCM